MQGGKYLAEERGAFDAEETSASVAVAEPERAALASAPLYEVAAEHDGQPAVDWLRLFMCRWNAEER